MKTRKNLSLSADAVARVERVARKAGKKLSHLVEDFLESLPAPGSQERFWDGELRPVARPADRRADYLDRKHA